MKLNLTVLSRSDFTIKSQSECYAWEINRDYLTNEKSQFSPKDVMNFDVGDFIIAKTVIGKYKKTSDNDNSVNPIYFGVIESEEKGQSNIVNARDFYNIVNFEFPATVQSGTNVQQHLRNLLNFYLINDPTKKAANIEINIVGLPIPWTYQPNDPPTSTNLNDYLVNVFKKYLVTWEAVDIWYDTTGNIHIDTLIGPKTKTFSLKNNVYDFANWSVYYTPANKDVPNKLLIVDRWTTTNMEAPTVLSIWYLQKDGTLTQSVNDNIFVPTINIVARWDNTEPNPPTFLELAQANLAGVNYSHEINFDVNLDSKIIYVPDLEIGTKANIVHGADLYPSVLTGYTLNAAGKWVSLKFGNIRSSLQSVLDSMK
jgi:hypothetical protein